MSEAVVIYNLERSLKSQLAKLESDLNGKILLKYYQTRVAEGVSVARILKCINTLRLISQIFGREFEHASKDDMIELVAKIERLPVGEWTKHDYKIILKRFYQWLRNCEDGEYPVEVKWIKCSRAPQTSLTKKHLLTPDEINRLVNTATNIRDKALILVLTESGRRIGDILSMKIDSVDFDDMGARLLVDGKTAVEIETGSSDIPSNIGKLQRGKFGRKIVVCLDSALTEKVEQLEHAGVEVVSFSESVKHILNSEGSL